MIRMAAHDPCERGYRDPGDHVVWASIALVFMVGLSIYTFSWNRKQQSIILVPDCRQHSVGVECVLLNDLGYLLVVVDAPFSHILKDLFSLG